LCKYNEGSKVRHGLEGTKQEGKDTSYDNREISQEIGRVRFNNTEKAEWQILETN
jgi:hypothetical protein